MSHVEHILREAAARASIPLPDVLAAVAALARPSPPATAHASSPAALTWATYKAHILLGVSILVTLFMMLTHGRAEGEHGVVHATYLPLPASTLLTLIACAVSLTQCVRFRRTARRKALLRRLCLSDVEVRLLSLPHDVASYVAPARGFGAHEAAAQPAAGTPGSARRRSVAMAGSVMLAAVSTPPGHLASPPGSSMRSGHAAGTGRPFTGGRATSRLAFTSPVMSSSGLDALAANDLQQNVDAFGGCASPQAALQQTALQAATMQAHRALGLTNAAANTNAYMRWAGSVDGGTTPVVASSGSLADMASRTTRVPVPGSSSSSSSGGTDAAPSGVPLTTLLRMPRPAHALPAYDAADKTLDLVAAAAAATYAVSDGADAEYAQGRRAFTDADTRKHVTLPGIVKYYHQDMDSLESLGKRVLMTLSRHIRDVFLPTLEANTSGLSAALPALKPAFLNRTKRTALLLAVTSQREVTLDEALACSDVAADTKFWAERKRAADGDKVQPWSSVSVPIPKPKEARWFGSGAAASPVAVGTRMLQRGKRQHVTETVNLWRERAELEAFLAPPSVLGDAGAAFTAASVSGFGDHAAAASGPCGFSHPSRYALQRISEWARDEAMSTYAGDAWSSSVDAEEASAAGLPTDSALLLHYFFCCLDAEVARVRSPGGASLLNRLCSSTHLQYQSSSARDAVHARAPWSALDVPELAPLLGAGAKDAVPRVRVRAVVAPGGVMCYVLHNSLELDVGNDLHAAVSLPRALGLFVHLLFKEAAGRVSDIDMSASLKAMLEPSAASAADDVPAREGLYSILQRW